MFDVLMEMRLEKNQLWFPTLEGGVETARCIIVRSVLFFYTSHRILVDTVSRPKTK